MSNFKTNTPRPQPSVGEYLPPPLGGGSIYGTGSIIAILKDDRILILEYKDAHLYAGAEEKKNIGELWEEKSHRRGMFVMPTERKNVSDAQ